MLFWIVDNQWVLFALCGLVTVGFAAAWWNTRNNKWLLGCAAGVALIVAVLVLQILVVTDRQQIERNIDAMRDALNNAKVDEAAKYFDDEVTVELSGGMKMTVSNKQLEDLARANMKGYAVTKVATGRVDFVELARPKAVVTFMVQAQDDSNKTGRCRMEFVLNSQGKWRAKTFSVESFIGGQKAPVLFWFGGAPRI
jgi:hypothetical protein